jgi:CelD/BcsL family acetyltransferase involved in cellulose biosynthesis
VNASREDFAGPERDDSALADLEIEFVDSLDDLRAEWTMLAEKSGNIFSTWELVSTWWRHFGRGREPIVVACRRRNGETLAIFPLYRQVARRVPIVRFMGHGTADQLGPVCTPPDLVVSCHVLRSLLQQRVRPWEVFLGEQLPVTGGWTWSGVLGGRTVAHVPSPIIRMDGMTWDGYLAARSPNFRQQVRRRERNLFRRHDVEYRLVTSSNALQQELDTLFRLHRARWRDEYSRFSAEEAFQREFAEIAQERGWLRLWFLELDGTAVAAWYGFRFGQAECFYQAGRDPSLDHETPGFVLFSHTIRQAAAEGLREYRLLQGGEGYKYRFATEELPLETVALARRRIGRTALAVGLPLAKRSPFKQAIKAILDV